MRTVAVLVGSLRKGSINHALAKALATLCVGRLDFRFVEIGDLPLYNDDLWVDPPVAVLRLKDEIAACDAVLMVSPEYNRGVSPVLKNAFDWGTRPSGQSVWTGKPAATAGASSGAIGTAVAQGHMRQSLIAHRMIVMGRPELHLQFKPGLIDETGAIADPAVASVLSTWAGAFADWVERFA